MDWPILNPDDPTRLIEPQEYQLDFASSTHFATLMAGGWGSGKSYAGLLYCFLSAYKSKPGTVGVVLQPDFPMMEEWLEEQLLPAFRRIMIKHHVKKRCIVLPGRRKLYYKSAHDPKKIQMSNAAWAYLDEPHLMKRQVWSHVIGRARKKNARLRVGLTSLPRIGWLSEHFGNLKPDDKKYRLIKAKTAWNKHLNPDYIDNLKRACPARMQKAYLEGEFVPLGGVVWPEFDRNIHLIDWDYRRYPRAPISLAIDWSPRKPHVLWIQRVPPGAVMPGGWRTEREVSVVIDQFYVDGEYGGITVRRLCEEIKRRGIPFSEAIVDPAGKALEATSGESEIIQAQRYLNVPILYRTGERIKVGVQHVQLALEPFDGHPYLYFARSLLDNPEPKARGIIQAIESYCYSEGKDGKLPDEPYDDDIATHACDCIRYHVRFYYPEDRLSIERWSAL